MTLKEGKDYICLVWKDTVSRKRYLVGCLSKNAQYEFNYGYEVEEAIKNGFKPLVAFQNINETYRNAILFPAFSSRLPDKKRRGIENILAKYGLKDYDEFELLKRTGARLPIDTLEFIDPILDDERPAEKTFFIAGSRHYLGCDGENCLKDMGIKAGDLLVLEPEPQNQYDADAVKVLTQQKKLLGYIPRYYSASIKKRLENKNAYTCTVQSIQNNQHCDECIQVTLNIQ